MPVVGPIFPPEKLRERTFYPLKWEVERMDDRISLQAMAPGQDYLIQVRDDATIDPRSADGNLLVVQRRLEGERQYWEIGRGRDLKELQDEAAELALHRIEAAGLNRVEGRGGDVGPVSSPWGPVQHVTRLDENVFSVSTAGHGGVKLMGERQRNMPASLKVSGGWYEEDCEWAKVATAYPDLYTHFERRHAEKALRDVYPEAWEEFYGQTLKPGESLARDRAKFDSDHKDDLVATSAIYSDKNPGFTEVWAQKGGRQGFAEDQSKLEHLFLVPNDEYKARGRFGFIIDTERHRLIGGDPLPAGPDSPSPRP